MKQKTYRVVDYLKYMQVKICTKRDIKLFCFQNQEKNIQGTLPLLIAVCGTAMPVVFCKTVGWHILCLENKHSFLHVFNGGLLHLFLCALHYQLHSDIRETDIRLKLGNDIKTQRQLVKKIGRMEDILGTECDIKMSTDCLCHRSS